MASAGSSGCRAASAASASTPPLTGSPPISTAASGRPPAPAAGTNSPRDDARTGGGRLIPALPLALVVPAGPSPDGAGSPCSQSGATGYTYQQAERTSAAERRHPMLQLEINDRPVVDSDLLIGIRNALLIEAGVAALVLLLYWLL